MAKLQFLEWTTSFERFPLQLVQTKQRLGLQVPMCRLKDLFRLRVLVIIEILNQLAGNTSDSTGCPHDLSL